MSSFARTLWDLLKLNQRAEAPPQRPTPRANRTARPAPPGCPANPLVRNVDPSLAPSVDRGPQRKASMAERYDALIEEMKQRYGVRVRKWRSGSSGCAWIVRYDNGEERRLVESPRPRGPMSCAIFLHEIGHHAIGFGRYRPRCLEEFHAWKWAIAAMEARGFNVTPAVQRRVKMSLKYAVAKATRRGLERIPPELLEYA